MPAEAHAKKQQRDPRQRRARSARAGGHQSVSRYIFVDRRPPGHPDIAHQLRLGSRLPLIFGAMLAIFSAATLAHLLLASVSRRPRETGLLKALGLVNGQIAPTVAWQATTWLSPQSSLASRPE
jgi:hypothetical protein